MDGAEPLAALLIVVAAVVAGYLIGRNHGRIELTPTVEQERASSATTPGGVGRAPAITVFQLTNALDDLRLGLVIYDAKGVERYRSRIGEQIPVARHSESLIEAALERVVSAARIDVTTEEEVRLYGPPPRTLLVQASPLHDDDGATSGVVATIEDVTEARHLDRVRSDFVANVSHELRTPVGALSVLAETLADTDDADVRRRLSQRILSEAERLSETIEDLLILSRLESDRDQPNETYDLLSAVSAAIERTAESSAVREVDVTFEPGFGGPVLVDGHFSQMVSAIVNLIENGTKYSSTGSEVTVSLGIDNGTTGPVAVLSVTDQGIGIPERDQGRIFERFYRVDSARRRETGGSGLGLSIVRNAVSNHNGTVTVESTEGKGSTFTVTVPLSPAQLQTEPLDVDDLLVE